MRVARKTPVLLFCTAAGCADPPWAATGVGPEAASAEELDEGTTLSFEHDRVVVADDSGPPAGDAAAPDTLAAGAGAPRVFFIWYADGGMPPHGSVCGSGRPPTYTCSFAGGDVDACKREVQKQLDVIYKDFNIVFTYRKPTSGAYYTEVVSTTNGWCPSGAGSAGIAPFKPDCSDANGNVCYAFACGKDARLCASTIAQEQAHLVGLEHTDSKNDVMYPSWPCTCPGFEDKDSAALMSPCRTRQNSYQMMKTRLGAWPGGEKPDPFGGGGGSGGGGAGGTGGSGGGSGGAGGGGGTGGAGGGSDGGGAAGAGGRGGSGGAGGTGGAGGGSSGGGKGGGGGREAGTVSVGSCAVGMSPKGSRFACCFAVLLALALGRAHARRPAPRHRSGRRG